MGQLEHARLALTPRAGKRAFLIAEKFAFQQPSGMAAQFTATNGLSLRRLAAWMLWANSSLPRARLPGDQDGGVALGVLSADVYDILKCRAGPCISSNRVPATKPLVYSFRRIFPSASDTSSILWKVAKAPISRPWLKMGQRLVRIFTFPTS